MMLFGNEGSYSLYPFVYVGRGVGKVVKGVSLNLIKKPSPETCVIFKTVCEES